jgi:peptidoglycan DL-endopeptidase CwlO
VATDADGERMAPDRQHIGGQAQRSARRFAPWWRPLAYSAATAAAIALLFNPLPAAAAPIAAVPHAALPDAAAAPAVPDPGSRPTPLGTLVMPGQTTPVTTAPIIAPTGIPTNPLVAKIEKRRAEVATLGDKLIKLGEDRDLALQQRTIADAQVSTAQAVLAKAQQEAAAAAAASMIDAAALPPGASGSGLQELDALAGMQRGDGATQEAAARQLAAAEAALASALAEQTSTATRATDLAAQYVRQNAVITTKQAALQKLEQKSQDALNAAEAAERTQDGLLGAGYLAGEPAGRGADPRAVKALQYALAQRGDPYEWSEEGPDTFDCSGLMYAAYRSAAAGRFPLQRVSRDQYWQTRNKVVDRYSLLPGDLLFFSYSNSWTGIHHVAMYAGDGMMVEAPRTGLNVRLVPVRWSRLFQATRVYGSVDGPTQVPDLPAPDPTKPTKKPTTKPTTKAPSPTPTTKAPKPTPTPTTKAPKPTPTTKAPSPTPTTKAPATTPPATTKAPASGPSPTAGAPGKASPDASAANSPAPKSAAASGSASASSQ